MAVKRFQDLEIYRLAEKLEDETWKIVVAGEPLAKDTVGRQMIRSADSIGANLAEGLGRGSIPENRRFVKIAKGSLCETQHWLRRAYCRQLLTQQHLDRLKPLIDELAPKLNAYLNSLERTQNKPQTPNKYTS